MSEVAKLNLLDEELDEATQKYLHEHLEQWKESVVNQLVEQAKQAEQAKLEELEEQNEAYRNELREEYTEKMLDGLNELKESIRAEVTAEVIKNNPELKVFEQIKEIVSPLVSENYRDHAYEDTITQLSEELESLKKEKEIEEGKKTLATLLAPYTKKTRDLVCSLIKEGTPDEVTEQFYNIVESISSIFEAEKDDDEDDSSEDNDSSEDDSSDEEDDSSDDEDEDDSSDDDEDETTQKESAHSDESYIKEGYEGYDEEKSTPVSKFGTIRDIIKTYARS